MGNRHDVVASDLDASHPRRNERRQGGIDKAMAMTAGTDRERQFITALNAYYNTPDSPAAGAVGQSCHGPVGPRDRVVAYEKAMRELYDKYPDDFEAQTFYALAVLAVGYATPDRHDVGQPTCKRLRFWKSCGRKTRTIPASPII